MLSFGKMVIGKMGAGIKKGVASLPPPSYTPALQFNDARNSQYAASAVA